jgi:hypothetical protein
MIIARVPSGIQGLDIILQGGIPTNSTIALKAEPSNHTEFLQQQFIAEGLKHGFPALYCCLSRPVSSVINSMKLQGFDVLEAIANSKAFSLAGGGNTIAAIAEYGLTKKIGYISTAGGALIEFLMGKKLPGVVALENAVDKKEI